MDNVMADPALVGPQPRRRPRGRFTRDDNVISAIADRYSAGEPATSIARRFGCHITSVYTALAVADIDRGPRGLSAEPAAVERILERRRSGESAAVIARDYAVTRQAISSICRKHGVADHRPQPLVHQEDVFAQIHARVQEGWTKTQIAADLGCSRTHIDRMLQRGIARRDKSPQGRVA